jgi:hypothetical protein
VKLPSIDAILQSSSDVTRDDSLMIDKNIALIELSENPATRLWTLDFDDLSLPEQVFCSIWELESQVNNGGFDQYYFNSSGDTAFAVESALRTIGAHHCADIVRRANSMFEGGAPPRDRLARQAAWDAISDDSKDRLDDLDHEFFQYPDDLTSLLYDYVVSHREEIHGWQPMGI